MNGDFSKKYDTYGNMLYKIAYLYFGNPHDSEDAMQEVFIKLLYKAPDFKDENHEKAWLIRTMQNTCLNMLKRPSKRQVSIEDIPLSVTDSDSDTRLDIIKAVVSLEPKYKTAVVLYYYYDYSVSKIAKTLKISNSAAKMRLKRGREQLKTELEGYKNE